ncbi:MAG: hypothetical protein AAGG59_00335 [Bacteroidota bacterium]
MKLFLTLTFVENNLDIRPKAGDAPDGYIPFDLDNFSDSLVVATAIKAIEQSDIVHVQIEAKEGAKLGGVLKVFNLLLKSRRDVRIHFNGSHRQIENMIKRFPNS